jgi:hypothetical protein
MTRNWESERRVGFTAFFDASVLYPSELRNLLMHLALTGLFRAKWSARVHEEWISALLLVFDTIVSEGACWQQVSASKKV